MFILSGQHQSKYARHSVLLCHSIRNGARVGLCLSTIPKDGCAFRKGNTAYLTGMLQGAVAARSVSEARRCWSAHSQARYIPSVCRSLHQRCGSKDCI